MPKAKKPNSRDADALKSWRKALPGVPDDQIVIPRYFAKDFCFSPPNKTDKPGDGWAVRTLVDMVVATINVRPEDRTALGANIKRATNNSLQKALRWWKSLGEPTPLELNQKLFTRNNKWKDICDLDELHLCLALCDTWLNLPQRQRTAQAAADIVKKLFRERQQCWLRGEIEPGVRDTRWDEAK